MSTRSDARVQGREHIPLFPKGFIAVRIIQLVFTLIILALSAYGLAISYAANGIVFILAIAIMTLITSIYHLVAWFGAPNIYNYWAVIALDILLVIMWLAAFALLASAVAIWAAYTGSSYYYYGYTYYTSAYSKVWVGSLAGAAAIGAMEFVLHIVSLSITSVMVHRHRQHGFHSQAGAARTVPTQGPPGAPVAAAAPVAAPAPVAYAANGEKFQTMQPVYAQQVPAAPVYAVQQPVYPVQQTMTPPPQPPVYPPQQTATPPAVQPYYPPQPLVAQQTGGSYAQQQPPVQVPHQPVPQHPQQAYQAVHYQSPPAQ